MSAVLKGVCEILRGFPSEYRLVKTIPVAPVTLAIAAAFPPAGRIVHINGSQQWEMGAVGTQMPHALFQNQSDADVSTPPPSGNIPSTPLMTLGRMNGYAATGAFEIETDQFDPTGTFNVSDPLHAPTVAQITTGTDFTMAGLLYNKRNWPGGNAGAVTQLVDQICGTVTAPPGLVGATTDVPYPPNAPYRAVSTLSYYPVCWPGSTASQ